MTKKINIDEKDKAPIKVVTIVSTISIVLNLLLGIGKIVVGLILNSSSVYSDGVHSTGDVLVTLIALLSVWIAAIKYDERYNYGHERWASVATLILSIIIFTVAFEILIESTTSLVSILTSQNPESVDPTSPLWFASVFLTGGSIVIKVVMFFTTYYAAKRAKSNAEKVEAFHQLIDALSSLAALASLIAILLIKDTKKANLMDPILSYPIVIMIVCVGIEAFKKGSFELTDRAIDSDTKNKVKNILIEFISEDRIKLIKSRIFCEKFYLDIYLLLDSNKSLKEIDEFSDSIKLKLNQEFDNLKNVNIIALPFDEEHIKQED